MTRPLKSGSFADMKNPGLSKAFALYGAAAMLGQVLAVRELLAALRGNELAVGAALGGWLLTAGTFSWLGGLLAGRASGPGKPLGWAFAAMSFLVPAAVAAPRVLLPLLGYSGSEVVPFTGVLLVTGVTLAFAAPIAGLMFPLAVAAAREKAEKAPAHVYMMESLGGFAAGAGFTFLIAPNLSPLQGAAAASLVSAAGAALMSGGRRGPALAAVSGVCALFSAALFVFSPGIELYTLNLTPHAGGEVVDARWSKYGEVSVVSLPGQHAVYQDGRYSFSVPDPDTAQSWAHLAMLIHRSPRQVLLIGGGVEAASEMLKHHLERLDYVEQDPAVIEAVKGFVSGDSLGVFSDPRLHVHFTDGRSFVKKAGKGYDVVAVMLPEPATAAINRYYTVEFFREVARILAPGGVFTTGLPSSPNYIGRAQLKLNGTIYRTLGAVFPFVRVTPEDTNRFFASMEPDAVGFDPETLGRRYVQRGIKALAFDAETPGYMLQPGRVRYVEERLSREAGLGINRDFRPAAYLYSVALWGEVAGLPALDRLAGWATGPRAPWQRQLGIIMAAGLALYFFTRRRPDRMAAVAVATTGFAGMSLEIAALLSFQAFYGYLYEFVGLLIALFMLGLFAGSRWGRAAAGSGVPVARLLLMMEAGMVLDAFALSRIGMMQGGVWPGIAAGFIIAAAGVWTGMEYPAALGLAQPGRPVRGGYAGLFYGLDLAGSGVGAVVCGLVLVPLFGIAYTALFVVVLKSATGAVLLAGSRR